MTKQGMISPELTPSKTSASDGEKSASADLSLDRQIEKLDSDFTHRARQAAAPHKCGRCQADSANADS